MNEADFIALLRVGAADDTARALTDDAAVFGDLVITHDMMVAGTHFLRDADPADVAWKLVATNLSDLAAKGARPLGVLLGFMLGDDDWDRGFAAGLIAALSHYETALWGGDTVAAPAAEPIMRAIGLTAIGRADHLPVPARSGAQAGNRLWVTGTLGLAAAGFLHDVEGAAASPEAIARFRRPVPRLAEGAALAPQVTAMMDISDGLLLDAKRMAIASGVTIALDRSAIPIAADLPAATRAQALRWGDDYELLFTLPPETLPAAAATCIGFVLTAGPDHLLVDGLPLPSDAVLGWQHRS
jgi:thiamine-monophosphate kinase